MKKFFYYAITLWGILWAQIILNHLLGGTWAAVDLVLIAVLCQGLSRGPWTAEAFGFTWGLLVDASSLGLIGIHALLYSLCGFIAGFLRRQLDESKVWTQGIFTFAISLLYTMLYLLLDRLFGAGNRPWGWALIIRPVANGILAPLVFLLLRLWTESWMIFPVEN